MSIHQDPALKIAVLNLPLKEKDKLLMRLISKDKMLIKQLHFQLLEDEVDLEERIIKLRDELQQLFDNGGFHVFNAANLNNFTGLNKLVKQASGMVNEHEKVTKDKVSEVEFRIFILEQAITNYPALYVSSFQSSAHKLHKYIAGRIKHALGKYHKIHEDYQFEYREHFQHILDLSEASALKEHIKALHINTSL